MNQVRKLKYGLMVVGGMVLAGVAAQSAHAGFSAFGGLHGGTINRYTAPTPQDPVKGGLVGLNYGWQAGVNYELGPIWTGAIYSSSNILADDYSVQTDPKPMIRYLSSTVVLPLMFRLSKGPSAIGFGLFYAHPLDEQSHQDSGFLLAAKVPVKNQLIATVNVLAGLREYDHRGSNIQTMLSLGYQFN